MRAITLKQPWAWLVVHGHKDIENRSWSTNVRGRVLIHAGKQVDTAALKSLKEQNPGVEFPAMPTGGIVGSVEIADCVTSHDSEWFSGPFGFVLANPQPCEFKPMPGKLGFWEVK